MIEGTLSDRYRLEGRIGQGGMAVVYCGFDTVLRRRVAIKVLREALAADGDFVARFYSEAQHAAKLSHPNIVSIYDVGRQGDTYYIVMELVDGATLGEMIDADTRLPEPVAIDFAIQLCSGLAYAHRQGLLHRDVKPANILVTKDDVVKLTDFGIARAVSTQTMTMTQPGMVMGSVFYIAPEQARGLEIHETSDLYSLGIVIYQMLSGVLPYTGESPIAVALKHVSNPIPALPSGVGTSPALAAIVERLLQKEPEQRYPSAVALAKALREARERPSHAASPVPGRNGTVDAARSATSIGMPPPKPRPSPYPDRPAPVLEHGPAPIEAVRGSSERTLAVVFIALVVLVTAAFAGYTLTQRTQRVFVKPAVAVVGVVGQPVEVARARLRALGLRTRVVGVTSLTVAARRVVRQDPGARATLAPGGVVALYVSTGMPTTVLIDVRHYSSDDAQRYLRTAKLVPAISEAYDEAAPGTVLAQRPAPDTTVRVHSTVALVVSRGPRPIDVPDLVSLSVADARRAGAARHLRVVVAERDPSDQIPADTVTSQIPAAGSRLARDGTVRVVVSSGAPQVTVPDLAGRAADAAARALADLGFVAATEFVVEPGAAVGTVLKQTPAAGTGAKKGGTVTLEIAVPGTVPDVAEKSPGDAQAALLAAGYKIGNTAYVQEGTEGTVVRTEPAAGSALRPGETVLLFVSGTPSEPQ
ncbi:MAG: Stk1 family PASTA domain-containing Ser/Thr kinase [Vulcanimicrobiaceae bacterium]